MQFRRTREMSHMEPRLQQSTTKMSTAVPEAHPFPRKKSPILDSAVVLPAQGPPVKTSLYTAVVCSFAACRASRSGSFAGCWFGGSTTSFSASICVGDTDSGDGDAIVAS